MIIMNNQNLHQYITNLIRNNKRPVYGKEYCILGIISGNNFKKQTATINLVLTKKRRPPHKSFLVFKINITTEEKTFHTNNPKVIRIHQILEEKNQKN